MTDIAERLSRARARLLLDHCFFGMLALKLELKELPAAQCPTVQTDGTTFEYSAEWVSQWSDEQLMGLWAHEVMHCAMGHPWRRHDREPGTWNVACDICINQPIRASGLELPPTELQHKEAEYPGWAAEAVYAKEKQEQKEGQPAPTPDFGNDVQDAPPSTGRGKPNEQESSESTTGEDSSESRQDEAEARPGDSNDSEDGESQPSTESRPSESLTEFDWQIETEVAMLAARRAGQMPGGIERLIKDARKPSVDWKTLLHRFVEQTIPQDYSWQRPNRRFVASGLYLPGMLKENTPRLDVIVDTSGSTQPLLRQFGSDGVAIIQETHPTAVRFIFCDTRVTNVQEFTGDDEITIDQLKFDGGGGTILQPAFDWIANQEEQPAAIICLTDLYIDQVREPEVPVLWIVPEYASDYAWGETVRMEGVA